MFDYLLAALSEEINIIFSYKLFRSLRFAPSLVPSVIAPFNINFMFPVPDASFDAKEICSEISHAGIIFDAFVTL